MIEYRFSLRPLTRRDAYASNIARAFDWTGKPRLEPPDLPRPEHVVSQPCVLSGGGLERAHEHDLVDMVNSGYLDSLGFDFRRADFSAGFRAPDTIRRGLS